MEVFTTTGYHNTAMDDIAARAGISKPIPYQHFAGKRDCASRSSRPADDEILANIKVAMDLQTSPKELIGRRCGFLL
jgi:AcrR family transcriptional regulator